MDSGRYYYHSLTHDEARANRLFGPASSYDPASVARVRECSPLEVQRLISLAGPTLHIPAFRIRKWGQVYVSAVAIAIDLDSLPVDIYRIVLVHNFLVEDRNPMLDECLAGVFLARRLGLRWEAAEDRPVECRSVELLGHVDTLTRQVTPP